MKKIINPGLAIVVLLAFLFTACNKQEIPIKKAETNTAPIAKAGNNITIRLPDSSALLDGSLSSDRENNIISYTWELVYGPSTVNIVNPDAAKTQVNFLVKGTYRLGLIVTDSNGLASGSFVDVMVLDTQLLNIKAANDTIIQLPYNRAFLNVAGDDILDVDFKWKKISGPNSFTMYYAGFKYTPVTRLEAGIYQFEICVTNSMQTTMKDTMTVTVLPDNNTYTAEKLFERNEWIDNYPATGISTYSITINNISSIIPTGRPFKVYAMTPLHPDWEIVPAEVFQYSRELYLYSYSISNDVMSVSFDYDPFGYGGNLNLYTAIKIVY